MRGCTVTADPLTAHLNVKQYGDFILTDAIRPALDVPIRPREGYRIEIFRDRANQLRLPMLVASVSAERLFDTFLSLLEPLGETVHAVLESSHGKSADQHSDFRRNHIDTPVLASYFCDFEDLLLNDGCTGVAVLSSRRPMEVQFDEHKLFTIYAPDLRPFQRVLRANGIRRRSSLKLIAEAEHLHHSTDDHDDEFKQLCLRVGVADFDRVFSDESFS